jgi:hypothetical protein
LSEQTHNPTPHLRFVKRSKAEGDGKKSAPALILQQLHIPHDLSAHQPEWRDVEAVEE